MPLRRFQIKRVKTQLKKLGACREQQERILKIAQRPSIKTAEQFASLALRGRHAWLASRILYLRNYGGDSRPYLLYQVCIDTWGAWNRASNLMADRTERDRLWDKYQAAAAKWERYYQAYTRAWVVNKLAPKPKRKIVLPIDGAE